MTKVASTALSPQDAAFLLFGQAMPDLDSDARADVVDCLHDGDYDAALLVLLKVIDAANISVDDQLLTVAQDLISHLAVS